MEVIESEDVKKIIDCFFYVICSVCRMFLWNGIINYAWNFECGSS